MTASEIDEKFDNGEDVLEYFDLSKPTRPNLRRVSIDLPIRVVSALDAEAERLGVDRQALIKLWIGESLALSQPDKKAS